MGFLKILLEKYNKYEEKELERRKRKNKIGKKKRGCKEKKTRGKLEKLRKIKISFNTRGLSRGSWDENKI